MFFNREDIEWFKPIELRTKHGRRGHIKVTVSCRKYEQSTSGFSYLFGWFMLTVFSIYTFSGGWFLNLHFFFGALQYGRHVPIKTKDILMTQLTPSVF
jgi:hypothetical protein